MKALFSIIVLAFAVNANARSIQPVRKGLDFSNGQFATVTKQENTQHQAEYSKITIKDGQITVEYFVDPCPPNAACSFEPAVKVDEITAPIVEQTEDCGSIVYRAFEDNTPSDGLRVSIEVQDNSTRMCRDMRPGKVEAKASSMSFWTQTPVNYEMVQNWQELGAFHPQPPKGLKLSKGVKLNKVIIDGQAEGAMYKGFVKVNQRTKDVTVSYQYHPCKGEGIVCLAIMAEREEALTLTQKYTDGCGSIVYKAVTKNPAMGGEYMSVEIVDNSTRTCEDVIPSILVVNGTISQAIPGHQATHFTLLK
jgi:hypothetical protein